MLLVGTLPVFPANADGWHGKQHQVELHYVNRSHFVYI